MTITRLISALSISAVLLGCSTTESRIDQDLTLNQLNPHQLNLTAIYKDKYFKAERGTYFRWLKDGSGYTVLEDRDKNKDRDKSKDQKDEQGVSGSDIVFYQPDGSKRQVLVSIEDLTPQGAEKALAIEDYQWSKDGAWLMIFTQGKKVWRSNSRGDFWLMNLKSKALFQLGGDNVEPSSLMFAKFSPDSQSVAYVVKNNIYKQSLQSKHVSALTLDGNEQIINGNFDWVYEEEFSIRDGFRWSPDSQKIAYWQLDSSKVKSFTMINNTDALYPTLQTFPYPKAGEKNSAVKVGVVNVETAKTTWADLKGDNRDRYIPRISWAGNSQGLLIQDVNRPQNTNKLWMFNPESEQLDNIFVDQDDAFLESFNAAKWIDNGNAFLWLSERDGYRHVYKVARDGSKVIDLTPGNVDMVRLLAFNEDKDVLYFTASGNTPEQSFLYKSKLSQSSKPVRVTPEQYLGTNTYSMSEDASWALHSNSRFNQPKTSRIIKVSDHSLVKTLVNNDALSAKLEKQPLPQHEFFKVDVEDGFTLDGYIMFPHDYDSDKKYPIVMYVYGEPAGQTVKDSWSGNYLFHSMLTEQGFIVASIDNRGTRAPKGRDWRKSIYKKMGAVTAKDQSDALKYMADRWPAIDTERVGVYGHSGGGTSTLNLLFRFPEQYHTGIAIAPVPDYALYDSIYQERYSGNPKTDPQVYQQQSAINYVDGLQGELLLIHGTGDDNVHYQGAERLINELVKRNKQFEFMSYPNRSHSLREGEGTALHQKTMMVNFFKKHLMQ